MVMNYSNEFGYEGPVPEGAQITFYDDTLFEPTRSLTPESNYAMAISLHESLVDTRRKLDLADYDPKSGLAGKLTFEKDLDRHIRRVERIWTDGDRRQHGLYMWRLDGDDMKKLNTEFGPEETDKIFAELGIYIRGLFRPTDGVYRPNRTGDEFWALIPTYGSGAREQMLVKATEIFKKISHAGAMHGSGHTFSIGIAEYGAGMGAEQFVQAANYAQELAKATKNRPNRPAAYFVDSFDSAGKPNITPILA